jgi:predicted homoserine dehydrogenase-like protein
MFMAQVRLTSGMHLVGVADSTLPARSQLKTAGWPDAAYAAASLADAHEPDHAATDNAQALIADPRHHRGDRPGADRSRA